MSSNSSNDGSQMPVESSSMPMQWDGSVAELGFIRQVPHSGHTLGGTASPEEQEMRLPRPDGGRDAWLFLAGCFVLEALVWGKHAAPSRLQVIRSRKRPDSFLGFPVSFGVFESFYSSYPLFADNKNEVAIIGTCSIGALYLLAPISIFILETWPSMRRLSSIAGMAIIVSSLIASSFAIHIWHLIFSQGVLYGIGGSLLYTPSMFYLDEWFTRRKGLAFGIMWAGAGT